MSPRAKAPLPYIEFFPFGTVDAPNLPNIAHSRYYKFPRVPGLTVSCASYRDQTGELGITLTFDKGSRRLFSATVLRSVSPTMAPSAENVHLSRTVKDSDFEPHIDILKTQILPLLGGILASENTATQDSEAYKLLDDFTSIELNRKDILKDQLRCFCRSLLLSRAPSSPDSIAGFVGNCASVTTETAGEDGEFVTTNLVSSLGPTGEWSLLVPNVA